MADVLRYIKITLALRHVERNERITGRIETPRTIGTATLLRAGHAFTHKLPPQSYSKTRLYPLH
jgi:hypothetical protein